MMNAPDVIEGSSNGKLFEGFLPLSFTDISGFIGYPCRWNECCEVFETGDDLARHLSVHASMIHPVGQVSCIALKSPPSDFWRNRTILPGWPSPPTQTSMS